MTGRPWRVGVSGRRDQGWQDVLAARNTWAWKNASLVRRSGFAVSRLGWAVTSRIGWPAPTASPTRWGGLKSAPPSDPHRMPRAPHVPTASVGPSAEADALLAALAHPSAPAIQALRAVIRGADPGIAEGVKWNAPSFATTEHFATFHLRHAAGVQVVLHLGAKPRPDAPVRAAVADPTGLLAWRGPDRATVTFRDLADVEAKREAFVAVVRQWIAFIA